MHDNVVASRVKQHDNNITCSSPTKISHPAVHVESQSLMLINFVTNDSKPLLTVSINNSDLCMEWDSGSSVTVCCKRSLESAGIVLNRYPCSKQLIVANGQRQRVLGRAVVDVSV